MHLSRKKLGTFHKIRDKLGAIMYGLGSLGL
jgi:hypothetical protein